MSSFEDLPDEFSFLPESFTPVETPELPKYTQLAAFNLGEESIDTSHPEDPEASKFTPCSAADRLRIIRAHVGRLAGDDAELISDEFLINGVSTEEGKIVPQITSLSIGVLASGQIVVVATDKSRNMIKNPSRSKSINPAVGAADNTPLKGAALDEVLEHVGESGRGFMITAALSADHKAHVTPTPDGNGKHVWAIVQSPYTRGSTQLVA